MSDIKSSEDKEDYSIEIDGKKYSFGGPCPPIEPMFFPSSNLDQKKGDDNNDSAQST